jgi:hypothetical protein
MARIIQKERTYLAKICRTYQTDHISSTAA